MTLRRARWLIALLFASACATPPMPAPIRAVEALRLSELRDEGDAQRRASLRLVLDGLELESEGLREQARGRFDSALQVDPTNPYVYLAVARQRSDGSDPVAALPFIDRAESLLKLEGALTPRVEVHLVGLRAAVHYATGKLEAGRSGLARARALSPRVWRDGALSPDELR